MEVVMTLEQLLATEPKHYDFRYVNVEEGVIEVVAYERGITDIALNPVSYMALCRCLGPYGQRSPVVFSLKVMGKDQNVYLVTVRPSKGVPS